MTYPTLAADAIEALESTADQFRESLQELNTVVSTLKTAFPNLFNTFQRGYQDWEVSWEDVKFLRSSNSADRAQGREWETLVAMGPTILPFVVDKLKDPDHIFAIHLYNELQTDARKKVDPDDLINYSDLDIHAQLIRRLYATQTVVYFLAKVFEWRAHQTAVAISSNSDDYLDHESYRALAAMDEDEIMPLVMAMYANDQLGWRYELLHELHYGRRLNTGGVMEYARWKLWFEESIAVQLTSSLIQD
jgi:hypothetical protein